MSQDDQAQKLTVKLEKLFTKFKRSKQELNDVQVEFQSEKEDILEAIRDLTREIRLSKLILDNFVPPEEAKFLEDCATWDDETQEWSFIMPTRRTKEQPLLRPASSTGCTRPTTDFSRVHRAMGDANPRFRYDQILQTDLDLPERFTEDIAAGELSEALKSAVFTAVGDESPKSKKGKAQGSFATATFPIARGLVSG
jgi:kinesin family protein 3/17